MVWGGGKYLCIAWGGGYVLALVREKDTEDEVAGGRGFVPESSRKYIFSIKKKKTKRGKGKTGRSLVNKIKKKGSTVALARGPQCFEDT